VVHGRLGHARSEGSSGAARRAARLKTNFETVSKKGHQKFGGRKSGQQNYTTEDLKQALLNAAMRVGFIHKDDVRDKDGKPTGRTRKTWKGEDGLEGYLVWAVIRSTHFLSLLGRVMPLQVNAKTEQPGKVVYQTIEEVRAALIAKRIDPDVLERAMMPPFPLPKPGSVQ
jgi:hypothetical protein